jgi:hypothetical protein
MLFLAVLVAMVTATAAVAPEAHATANYDNAANADVALRYAGQWGGNACRDAGYPSGNNNGQCRQFATCVVWMASNHVVNINGRYYAVYARNGVEVSTAQARKGDLIQLNKASDLEGYYSGMHTAIVVAPFSGNSVDVVDSNFRLAADGYASERVHHHVWNPIATASAYGLEVHIWRFGQVAPTPPPTPHPPARDDGAGVRLRADFNGDGRSDVLAVTARGPSGLNFVPLLSNGVGAFTHGGLWFNTGTDYTLDQVRLAAGDFNGDGRSDVLLVTPRGASGLNFVPLLSNGSAFTHGGLWFNTGSDYTLDQMKLVLGDFNADRRDDVLLVTPRGASGLNFVPLLSNGAGFGHGGLWWNTGSDYTLDEVKLVSGDFNADARSDVLLVTPRGLSGLNFVPLLSNGVTAFTHGGLWWDTGTDYTLDQVTLVSGDFNADGRDDVLLVTPRGPSGLNLVALLANGSTAFSHGGLWWNTGTDYSLEQVKFAAGDFNADARSDVLLVTPRGSFGLNFVPLLSNGSAFSHGGLWFNTGSDYTLDQVKLV